MSWRPCKQCRSWGNCEGFETYELADIQFCKAQVMWLLGGEAEFVRGDAPGSRRVASHAGFVPVADLRAEVDYRVERTGRDGQTLLHELRVLNVRRFLALSQAARDAVNYIAGRKRKQLTYPHWLRQRNGRGRIPRQIQRTRQENSPGA